MSGGSFDYAYSRAQSFAMDLEARLDDGSEWEPETVRRLRLLVEAVRSAADGMHAAEWLYSGDIGEDTFMARTEALVPRG
jgi:hypothetical protein